MKNALLHQVFVFVLGVLFVTPISGYALAQNREALKSWSDSDAKTGILDLVASVSDPASKDSRPPQKRIAVFDNDGTLWPEQPS